MNTFRLALRACALALPLAATAHAEAPIPQKTYGQELVDRTLARNPGLRLMLLRAIPPGAGTPVVAASSIGRIGGGHDELELGGGGEPHVAVLPGGRNMEVELPLDNLVGEPVGTLDLVWPYRTGAPLSSFTDKAQAIRHALARRILNSANLFDPYPLDPAITTANRAQELVDAAQAAQPEIEVLALRGRVGNGELVLLGSTFGRQGKKADGDDLKVLASTTPNTGVYSNGKRFGVDLALHDRAGTVIGTMNVGYAWQEGGDGEALVRHALALRQRLEAQIAPGEALDALAP